jgi:hypothetical protein
MLSFLAPLLNDIDVNRGLIRQLLLLIGGTSIPQFQIRYLCLLGLDPDERDQRDSQIAYLFQQAMQRGLIGYGAGYQRVAVFFQRDGQVPEPLSPLMAQMAFDPDLIDRRLPRIRFRITLVCHGYFLL